MTEIHPFEIEVIDILGVPTRAWKRAPLSLRTVWDASEAHGPNDYLVYKDERLTFADRWFHTGDLGHLDAEGNLYVVDRIKDIIVRGGENIHAAEVEAALFEHPDITDAAIIGVPHDRLGEEVATVIRPRPGASLTEQSVKDHVAERLAAFKVPAAVWFIDGDLPRDASGKVLKRELREKLFKSKEG